MKSEFRPCIIVPMYNHAALIGRTLDSLEYLGLPCLIIDDGSDQDSKQILRKEEMRRSWVSVETSIRNGGKGRAVKKGIRKAAALGYTHALLVDADGQHDGADAKHFFAEAKQYPEAFIVGSPVFDTNIPRARLWGRQLSRGLSWIQTLSFDISDILCGYRLYPLASVLELLNETDFGDRMEFDVEIAVHLHWKGVPVRSVSTAVAYPKDGVSHFRYFGDNVLLILAHVRLLFGMLLRLPKLVYRKMFRRGQTSEAWYRATERGSVFAFRLILFLFQLLGRRLCRFLIYPIIAYFFLTDSKSRNASRRYLERVYQTPGGPEALGRQPDWRMVFEHMLEFGFLVLDKVSVWAGAINIENIVWDNSHEFRRLVDEQKGGILFGAHMGNMEITRALSEEIPGLRVHALMFRGNVKIFQEGIQQVNPKVNVRVIPLEKLAINTAVELQEQLAAGDFVAMLGDRTTAGAPDKVVQAPFMGAKATFPQGPFVLASLLGWPVYLLFCFREGPDRFRVYFEKFSDKLELPRARRQELLEAEVKRFAARLEHFCLRAPLQWFNFYDFWRDADGEWTSVERQETEIQSKRAEEQEGVHA